MSDTEEEKINENELTATVITKYQAAADIANRSLKELIANCTAGKTILELCQLGDATIEKYSKTVYNKDKKMQKGIAFPTCVSPNQLVCHLSPLESDKEATMTLKEDDLVHVELGAHVDGYVSQVAHTFVVGASKEKPVTGKRADVLKAAHLCCEAAARLIKAGNTNTKVTTTIDKVCEEMGCKPVQGMLTYQVLRNVLDGPKQIVLNPQENQKGEEVTFEEGEVYTVDILVSSGDGKLKETEIRTTIFKRNPNATYQLKMKTARAVFSQIQKKCGTFAFSLRQFEDEKQARMGIIECQTHQLVAPHSVSSDKEGDVSAHFVYTLLLLPNGGLKLSSFYEEDLVKSEITVKDEELVALFKTSIRPKKKAAKK